MVVFLGLIGYLLEQRRHIKFLENVNYNQETHDIMTAHQLELTKQKNRNA